MLLVSNRSVDITENIEPQNDEFQENKPIVNSATGDSDVDDQDAVVEEDVEEEEEEEEEYQEELPPRKRGRRRKITPDVKTNLDDLPNVDDEDEDHVEDEEEDEEEEEEVDEEEDDTVSDKKSLDKPIVRKGKRGRKPLLNTPEPITDSNKDYDIVDDEYNLSEDEEGETKISKNGELYGNRKFRVRTFKVIGRGEKLYMLSTEPARCMGFRDSYLLFQKHRLLHKIVLSSEEKFDLIDRDIIPHSYKGRVIGLVTARSVFREFGAKIIVGGKTIIDDYYVTKLKKRGVIEGEIADPNDIIPNKGEIYNTNQYVAWLGASAYYLHGLQNSQQPQHPLQYNYSNENLSRLESLELKSVKALRGTNAINEENWMYLHAHAVRDTDRFLFEEREGLFKGLKDPYTGVLFVPNSTQPTRVKYKTFKESNNNHKLIYETLIAENNLIKHTGLKNVPLEIFDGIVDEDVKQAILRQQEFERSA
ncbi:hypothetical protein WICMUC_003603 [Wickerhamomyces mucosus]|uniref:Chromatin structure-remodeling complex protein RSC7 n=1 Tax=Wickerhamomyces mucosus TaxID=1378264 RepID=A0A9P8PLB6_9ASCO|nr:hypothetical protein WICMUC_003603 [Wickerhamomyces mucosus]